MGFWLKPQRAQSKSYHGSEARLTEVPRFPPFAQAMVLIAEDIAAISHIVSNTLAQMNSQHIAHRVVGRAQIDEKHYRKTKTFDGANWKDLAFQVKAATRSSSNDTYNMLCWVDQEASEIRSTVYDDN